MESIIGPEHMKYKNYTVEVAKITSSVDEIAYLIKNLDTEKINMLLKDITENYDYVPKATNGDDYGGDEYSIVEKTSVVVNEIIEGESGSNEYSNMTSYITTNLENITRKCNNLKTSTEIFKDEYILSINESDAKMIKEDYRKQFAIYESKIDALKKSLEEIEKIKFLPLPQKEIKFNIQLIAINDIMCIIGYSRFKMILRNLHVSQKEVADLEKEDIEKFKKDLYAIYSQLCEIFNSYLKGLKIDPIKQILDQLKADLKADIKDDAK